MPMVAAQDIASFGQRDLSNEITIADEKATPFYSMVRKMPAAMGDEALIKEWPVDVEEVPTNSAVVEGTDLGTFDNAQASYAQMSNRIQWTRVGAQVGTLATIAQNQAGIANKEAYAVRKKTEQLKRSLEAIWLGEGDSQVGTGTVPNKTKQMGSFINLTQAGATAVPTAFITPTASIYAGTMADLTEDGATSVQTVLTSQYLQTGKDKVRVLLCGTTLKTKFTSFLKSATTVTSANSIRTYDKADSSRKISNVVDVYQGDFGTYELMTDLFLNWSFTTNLGDPRRGYALDMDRWAVDFKRKITITKYQDQGGGPRFGCDAVHVLVCKNPIDQAAFKAAS